MLAHGQGDQEPSTRTASDFVFAPVSEAHPNCACPGAFGGDFSGSPGAHRNRQQGLGM